VVQGKDELLGRTVFSPQVEVISSRGERKPKLLWYPIIQKGQRAGEALLAAELLLKDKVGLLRHAPGSQRLEAIFVLLMCY